MIAVLFEERRRAVKAWLAIELLDSQIAPLPAF